jgi:hypothetical protein
VTKGGTSIHAALAASPASSTTCASPSGAIHAKANNITSLDACEALCERCPRCNYVSFSVEHDDCSWYVEGYRGRGRDGDRGGETGIETDTGIMREIEAETQRHRDTETQRHGDTETQRHSDAVTQ